MRIEIIHEQSKKERIVYGFNVIGFLIVLVSVKYQEIPKGKRKFIDKKWWDAYYERDSTSKEPTGIPLGIAAQALSQAQSYFKVKSWSEFKGL